MLQCSLGDHAEAGTVPNISSSPGLSSFPVLFLSPFYQILWAHLINHLLALQLSFQGLLLRNSIQDSTCPNTDTLMGPCWKLCRVPSLRTSSHGSLVMTEACWERATYLGPGFQGSPLGLFIGDFNSGYKREKLSVLKSSHTFPSPSHCKCY